MTIHHALVLNFHQPTGNLEELLARPNPEGEDGWEAKEILMALDRMPRMLWGYEDTARVHVVLSGLLLETLANPDFQDRVYGTVKCGDLLWYLQNRRLFQLLGTAYYHAVLPLIPPGDWVPQLERWRQIAAHLFPEQPASGLWPPEMGFSMEMIPTLRDLGYRYVLVDSENVEPVTPMAWHELRYRPHYACYDGACITAIVRDRELSNAQESGMDVDWFLGEVHARTQHCDFEPLVTTASDGDNGGWFRNFRPTSNFWNAFYQPLLERSDSGIQPTFLDEYLDHHGADGEIVIRRAAWNTGEHSGRDFLQWTGSARQRDTLARVWAVSERFARLTEACGEYPETTLESIRWRVLRAETSCYFFWGESWCERAEQDLNAAETALDALEADRDR